MQPPQRGFQLHGENGAVSGRTVRATAPLTAATPRAEMTRAEMTRTEMTRTEPTVVAEWGRSVDRRSPSSV
jgi:hypothetical protein